MAFSIKNEILVRVYIVLGVLLVVAGLIVFQTVKISVLEGEKWRAKGERLHIKEVPVEAERGNILTEDGSMLATSMPFFDIAFDPNSSGMDSADWNANIDSLAYCLATFVDPSFTPGAMKEELLEQRQKLVKDFLQSQRLEGRKYIMIKKNASLGEKEMIADFPLFNQGQFKGGFIAIPKFNRQRPFGMLAQRTVGYVRGDSINVGLEGYFNNYLKGEEGKQLMYRVGEGVWMPLNDLTEIEPKGGEDIVTTVDVNLQGVVQSALSKAMVRHQAEFGTAILMEVKTGDVKAIANLGWTKKGKLMETYNHAVGSSTEPGSTMKLASALALLEDGYIDLADSVDLEQGRTMYFDAELEDSYIHTLNNVTFKKAFGMSSNVGISRLIYKNYGENNNADKYIGHLRNFFLDRPTGIEINGEPTPYIKKAYSDEDQWSGTTLPWMSIGYELTVTPLQLAAFYNAVANDGVYMKPRLVSEVQHYGETIKRFPVTKVKGRIASEQAVQKAQQLLECVVDSTWGTAHKHRSKRLRFAGKTGTAQLGYQRLENRTKVKGYQASFAGYFPSEQPVYTCVVLISKPKVAGIYGGQVALPVFKEIAEKVYRSNMELYPVVNDQSIAVMEENKMPRNDAGYLADFQAVLTDLDMHYFNRTDTDWTVLRPAGEDTLKLVKRPMVEKVVPNVVGMGMRDALYLLENQGLRVEINGKYGKVRSQSIRAGTRANRQTIWIKIS